MKDLIKSAVPISLAAAEGLDRDGSLWYEQENNTLIYEKHSWPQAEAMIGFFNAYQLTGNEKYFRMSINSWEFIKYYIRDNEKGEWFWGVKKDYTVMKKDKSRFLEMSLPQQPGLY